VNVEEVGRELGVRYVAEGSVRRSADRVRITVQLIDATTGFHLWSEQYDRELADIFAVQSEISRKLVGALSSEIHQAMLDRLVGRSTRDLVAYDLHLKATSHFRRFTRADNLEARRLLERAIERDPNFAPAVGLLGATYFVEYTGLWNLDEALLERAEELARRALALDPTTPGGHVTLAGVHAYGGRLDEALAAAERATTLAPNVDTLHLMLASISLRQGRVVAALQSFDRALRLNPRGTSATWVAAAWVNLAAGRTEQAVEMLERERTANPDSINGRVPLAAIYEGEGRHDEARKLVREILRVNPQLTVEATIQAMALSEAMTPEFKENLRKAGLPDKAAATQDFTVPGFGTAPAIAVLPFDNLSGDPEQEYFADGIAEDLINRLSTWGVFPVIARNSSFTYKGKAVDVKQVSRELGVRYVVEGSVRKAAERVRITAQLIDATSGHHVWTETYDRELRDIFALQDQITRAIGASMGSGLWEAEEERTARRSAQSVDSYDYTMRGFWHFPGRTKEENRQARMLFQRAAELDPRSALALAGLAYTHVIDIIQQWTDSPRRSVTELDRSARRCISLDDRLSHCQHVMCHAYNLRGHTAKAIAACELAVQLNPSLATAYSLLGATLAIAGQSDEGIEKLETAMRLSPQDSMAWTFFQMMSLAHLGADRYQEAADWAQRSLQLRPDEHNTHALLAISYAHLGRLDEAQAEFGEVLRLQPDYSLAGVEQVFSGADPGFLERVIGGLRKAGLKEE
jgi:TolB-like protein/Flp pilus assembly protein TadD